MIQSITSTDQLCGIHMKRETLPNGGTLTTFHTGNKYWMMDDLYHREDGPAIEYNENAEIVMSFDKTPRWFYHGIEYFPKDNEEWLRMMKMKALL